MEMPAASASCPFTFLLLTTFSLAKSKKAEKQKSYSPRKYNAWSNR